jgi:alkaline phosphatase D
MKSTMMHLQQILLAYLSLCTLLSACTDSSLRDEVELASAMRIAVGSCSHEYDENQMWEQIQTADPDLYIWLGDNIYGDSEDMSVLAAKYHRQKSRASYQSLISKVPVIGIWDDHDFGKNDAGKSWPYKNESKKLLLDFLDVPDSAAVRNRSGIYQSFQYGEGEQTVKIILLDTRYFRDDLVDDPNPDNRYLPAEGTILGEEQWVWLEKELRSSTAKVNIIASGIQILPREHGFEKWDNFPSERQRLLDLINTLNISRPLLLSGDRHISEISRIELPDLDDPLVEFTSSGLTHSYEASTEKNSLRKGPLVTQKSFGVIDILWKKSPEIELTAIGRDAEVFLRYSF